MAYQLKRRIEKLETSSIGDFENKLGSSRRCYLGSIPSESRPRRAGMNVT
jgi:hypothetical protein